MSISGNLVGSYSQIGKTFVLVDDAGNELVGVVTDSAQVFDATDNDVREGKTYVSDNGASTGTKIIPSYHTKTGAKKIMPDKPFIIRDANYDYDFLQAIICSYNTSLNDSVASSMIAVNDNIYAIGSVESIALVEKDHENNQINLNIINNTGSPQILRYMFIKEMF